MIKFNLDKKTKPKVFINIGCLLDVPTSSIVTGKKGETILNGGLGPITAVVGTGNNFKSTITHFMMLSAANRVCEATETSIITYDTEMNMSLDRLEDLASRFESLPKNPITGDNPNWTIADKANIPGNEWAVAVNKYTDEKEADKGSKIDYEPFKDPYGDKALNMNIPSFVEIDSMSEFEAKSSMDMLSKDLDSSDTNTFAMKQGLFKSKFISTIPTMSVSSNTYFLFTAQLGEKMDMRTGPAMYSQPFKNLQYLKNGEHIKGVSPKFFFLIHNAWYAHTAKLLVNDTTKLPEYPLGDDKQRTDLNVVTLTQLRGKNGPSGYNIPIVVSQTEGVLPSLSEFHYIKENGRYGIEGNNIHYHLDLYPDVKLSRTTVRSKINTDPKLRRALNITAELYQLEVFHSNYLKNEELLCTPKELYEDIKKLGYNWDELLETRGYWVINQYKNKVPFLSTLDLLRMRKGLYKPYFIKDTKINDNVKKESDK